MDDILGTSATNTSDLVLLAYVFLLLPGMIIGFFFARRKLFVPYHKFTMTGITLVNWVLIAFVMVVSYSNYIAPYVPENFSDIRAVVATIHLLSGAIAQGLATYLVILMWTERTRYEGMLPMFLRIRRIKTPMRLTLALWVTTVVLGLGIYFTWYVGGDEDPSALAAPGATEQAEPAVTPELNADVGEDIAENATPPAVTEDVRFNVAATENVTPPAVTEEAGAGRQSTRRPPAVTEEAFPCPVVTEAVMTNDDDSKDDDDDLPPPAVTEAAFPCIAVTESVESNSRPRPAFTESVDDDRKDDDDNSGKGSSNSGSGSSNSGSGSSNSGKGSSDDKDDDD
jgi:uncharacterized membrane protein YgcG